MDANAEAPAGDAAMPWDILHASIWRAVLQELPARQRFQAAVVCSAWRRHALSLCSEHLAVTLHSSRSCGALGLWLKRHGHTLVSLDITDNYYMHQHVQGATRIRPVDRLALLQVRHMTAAAAAGQRPQPQQSCTCTACMSLPRTYGSSSFHHLAVALCAQHARVPYAAVNATISQQQAKALLT
jgi:hypothetical protein